MKCPPQIKQFKYKDIDQNILSYGRQDIRRVCKVRIFVYLRKVS